MEYMEFKGTTKSDAITEACTHFSVTSDKLEYEVIEEGKSGFLGLGIGAKPAVIKARVKEDEKPQTESSSKPAPKPVQKSVQKPAGAKYDSPKAEHTAASETVSKPSVKVDGAAAEATAKKFLEDVFKAMGMTVDTAVNYDEAQNCLNVNLSGEDMGVLIGKRGQTLDSLQYLISLVLNKGTGDYIRIKVDTENYRERRKETLENLARNISFKVKRTRRPVSLEPMNPYERRIIHSALQNDRYVTTHSEGEEPFRRVVIVPKRENTYSNRGSYNRGGSGYNKSYSKGGSYGNKSYGRGGYSKSYSNGYSNGGYSNNGYNSNYKRDNATDNASSPSNTEQDSKAE